MAFLKALLFPPPPSIFLSVMTVIGPVSVAFFGVSEIMGRHLSYSKFWDASVGARTVVKQIRISSRTGMLLLYTPAMIAAVVAPFTFYGIVDDVRAQLVTLALAIHFGKRVFEDGWPSVVEVLFVHHYSGNMMLDSAITISLSYFSYTATTIYSQYLAQNMAEPAVDLKYAGIILFLAGITGNFYHHYLLSKLRAKKGETGYKIPKGGLFGFVICPHYFFEILSFIGFSFLSQTVYAFASTLGTIAYLLGRSYVTRQWYLKKFEDFPKDVKALIPFVF